MQFSDMQMQLSARIGQVAKRLPQGTRRWPIRRSGSVAEAMGLTLRVVGLPLRVGDVCSVEVPNSNMALNAEVVGVQRHSAVLMPFGELDGVSVGAAVHPIGTAGISPVGSGLLGRVVDAFGKPVDGRLMPPLECNRSVSQTPPEAMKRLPINKVFRTGIRCIDALTTVGRGQRVGIFAPAGVGKTTLLAMLARSARVDVIVIALIGERGRELKEFLEDALDPATRARAVVVISTSDMPAMTRAKAALYATAVCEYFRDVKGLDVLLVMDSLTRYARALREIGLATGEPPARRGYPPSVFAQLPRLLERAGNSESGTLTAFYTVLMEDEDVADPIAEEVRSILDGHLVLTRKLASEGHFPAIDARASLSRLMTQLVPRNHQAASNQLRRLMSKYDEVELLLQVGEYRAGSDPLADLAIQQRPAIARFLQQNVDESASWQDTLSALIKIGSAALIP
jgi:ATP synthase in type III secretion protein N